jgi:ribosome-associated translation inhibitor RaiA
VTSLGNPKVITLLWAGDRSKHLLRFFSCDISLQATAIDLRRQGCAADAYHAFERAIEPIQKRITEARSRCYHRCLVATDCSRNIQMTPLCKVEVTLPPVLGSREKRHGGGVDEQAGVQPP